MSGDLIQRLHDEADLCCQEGAEDISVLLGEAAARIKSLEDELEAVRAQPVVARLLVQEATASTRFSFCVAAGCVDLRGGKYALIVQPTKEGM